MNNFSMLLLCCFGELRLKINLKQWVKKFGWETVLNKRGTTWRKLSDDIKDNIDETSAIQVMQENTSAIKRPVLESGNTLLIGFKEDEYKTLL